MERLVKKSFLRIPLQAQIIFTEEETRIIRERVKALPEKNLVDLGTDGDKIVFDLSLGAINIIRKKRATQRSVIADAVTAIRFLPTIGLNVKAENAINS